MNWTNSFNNYTFYFTVITFLLSCIIVIINYYIFIIKKHNIDKIWKISILFLFMYIYLSVFFSLYLFHCYGDVGQKQ